MFRLSESSASKLESILLKRIGKKLSRDELEDAYNNLMSFAHAVIELDNADEEKNT